MATNSDRGLVLNAVTWAFFVIALVISTLRLYSDILIIRFPRLDTYIASVVFALIIASQISTDLAVHYGMGQHVGSLDPMQIMYTLKWSWIAQILQLIANTGGRLAVIAYLTTIQGPTHPKAKRGFLGTLAMLQLSSIVVLVAIILAQCAPLEKLWNERLPGTCNGRIRNRNFAFFQGGLSALTDILLVVYPMVLFWSLQLKTTKKVALSALFGCGILVDMYVVFIAGSVPTLRPFFKKYIRKTTLPKYRRYSNHRTLVQGDDDVALVNLPVLPSRVAIYSSAAGPKGAVDNGDLEGGTWRELGDGGILKTTRIDTRSDSET
ncbi:MAG: hypothetical protein Q9170_005339 [Blastenia crenularia]